MTLERKANELWVNYFLRRLKEREIAVGEWVQRRPDIAFPSFMALVYINQRMSTEISLSIDDDLFCPNFSYDSLPSLVDTVVDVAIDDDTNHSTILGINFRQDGTAVYSVYEVHEKTPLPEIFRTYEDERKYPALQVIDDLFQFAVENYIASEAAEREKKKKREIASIPFLWAIQIEKQEKRVMIESLEKY